MRSAFASAMASGSLYEALKRFCRRSTKLSSCDLETFRAFANCLSSCCVMRGCVYVCVRCRKSICLLSGARLGPSVLSKFVSACAPSGLSCHGWCLSGEVICCCVEGGALWWVE